MERVLRVRIDGAQAEREARDLNRQLDGMDRRGARTSRTMGQLGRLIGAIGFGAIATDMVRTITQFDTFERTLQTFTGSADLAADALDALVAFSDTIPASIEDTVSAFTQMRALGLEPTEEALTSFANTGAAMGKTLGEVVAAVADAGTFQFERLREAFGITTKTLDDTVLFTFQGVTTEVEKSSEAITAFLTTIGNEAFTGSATRNMEGLAGSFSNLRTAAQRLFDEIGGQGAESGITKFVNSMTEGLEFLTQNVDIALQSIVVAFRGLQVALLTAARGWAEFFALVEESLAKSDNFINNFVTNGQGGLVELENSSGRFREIADSLAGSIGVAGEELGKAAVELERLNTAADEAPPTLDEVNEKIKENAAAAGEAAEETETLTDAQEELLDKIDPTRRLIRDFSNDLSVLTGLKKDGKITTEQYTQGLEILGRAFQEDLKDAVEDTSKCLTQLEKDLKAIDEITLDNIGDAFGTFFSGLTLDFDRLFDDLVSIAQQRSKDLFNAAFQDFQQNGFTSQNLGTFAQAIFPQFAGQAFGGSPGASQGAQLGGLAGGAIATGFGLTGFWGAAAGPIGAVVGAIIGSIFDDSNPPRVEVVNTLSNADPRGIRAQSPFTDQFGNPIFVAGRQITEEFGMQEGQDAVNALAEIDRIIFNLLDDDQRFRVGQALVPGGNRETSSLFSGDFTIDEIALDRFNQILGGIGGVVESLVRGTNFSDVETGIQALASVQNIFGLLNTDVQELRDSVINGPTSLVEAFEFQKEGVRGLIESFDGSLASLQALEGGLQGLATSAQQAFALIEQTSQQIAQRSEGTIFGLRFGALGTPEEQFDFIDAEIERLVALLPSLTDPGQINSTLARIESLTGQANSIARGLFTDEFGNFDQAGFSAFTESQIAFLEDQQQIAQDLLQGISDTIANGLTDVFSFGADSLAVAAEPIETGGRMILEAAKIMQGVAGNVRGPRDGFNVGAEAIRG